jgi:hypothetical protein
MLFVLLCPALLPSLLGRVDPTRTANHRNRRGVHGMACERKVRATYHCDFFLSFDCV